MSKGSEEQDGRRPAWTVRRGLPPKPSATLYPSQDPLQYCRVRCGQGNADGPSCVAFRQLTIFSQCSSSSALSPPFGNFPSPPPHPSFTLHALTLLSKNTQTQNTHVLLQSLHLLMLLLQIYHGLQV